MENNSIDADAKLEALTLAFATLVKQMPPLQVRAFVASYTSNLATWSDVALDTARTDLWIERFNHHGSRLLRNLDEQIRGE